MENPKIYVHGSYIGTTGYNHHTRDFFRELSKHTQLKVRNFTIGKSWDGYNLTPHDNEPYINNVDKEILYQQILWNSDDTRSDYPIYPNESKDFLQDLNIVLCETNHHLFYDKYIGPKIAYNVWESTLQPEEFFNKLFEFDELWVPSKWQRDVTIQQGYPEEKIQVVPEGVDVHTFFPEQKTNPLTKDRFTFFLAGRWDYRKSIKEIIETFLKTFDKNEPIDLIISVDNPFSNDGMTTTEERLKHYSLDDERIKVLHFPPREEYVDILKSTNVFVSCARSEGWNLPLIESMACGTVSIYSNCSGQLEFAENRGLPVNILCEKPSSSGNYNHFNDSIGNYYEPDFDHLSQQMIYAYENWDSLKRKALKESEEIRNEFSWERVGEIGYEKVKNFMTKIKSPDYRQKDTNRIEVSYLEGPKVEIIGSIEKEYFVEFLDDEDNVIHSQTISTNMWTVCSRKYYTNWKVRVNGEIVSDFDLNDKRVLISLESKSIGDTIAWTPYAVEFAKKHNCKVVLSTFHNEWFEGLEEYKEIEFIQPGSVTQCYVVYRIGWFRSESGGWNKFDSYPNYVQSQPLQKTASDILGLEFIEQNKGINFEPKNRPYKNKYVVFSPESTAGCKEWTYEGWKMLSKMIKQAGYDVVILTTKRYFIEGTKCVFGKPIGESMNILYHSEFLVSLSSGLAWINWALGKHTVMISGFTPKDHEFQSNITRLQNEHSCNSCWSNPNFTFDGGDWDWCPIWKGTDKQHICQKSINPITVFNSLPI